MNQRLLYLAIDHTVSGHSSVLATLDVLKSQIPTICARMALQKLLHLVNAAFCRPNVPCFAKSPTRGAGCHPSGVLRLRGPKRGRRTRTGPIRRASERAISTASQRPIRNGDNRSNGSVFRLAAGRVQTGEPGLVQNAWFFACCSLHVVLSPSAEPGHLKQEVLQLLPLVKSLISGDSEKNFKTSPFHPSCKEKTLAGEDGFPRPANRLPG